jgi:hypothetical protein
LHFTKKTQMASIKLQPSKSAVITFGEKSKAEWPSPLAMGVTATNRLRQKMIPQVQIVIAFRFIISSPPLLSQSPLLPPFAGNYTI